MNAFAQIARCAERQGGIWLTSTERAAIDALSTHRGAETPPTPLVVTEPFAECRPPMMHVYLNASDTCVCGERGRRWSTGPDSRG